MQSASPTSATTTPVDLQADQEREKVLAQLPQIPLSLDSITHVVCFPQVFGVQGNNQSSVRILCIDKKTGRLIDDGSNVCITDRGCTGEF
jgi:hypothetical protein